MLSGDTRATAERVAKEVGISRVFAEVRPEQKADYIQRRQREGRNAMVGAQFWQRSRGYSLARELIVLPRFKRDYRNARRHPDFDAETLEYLLDLPISGEKLPSALR